MDRGVVRMATPAQTEIASLRETQIDFDIFVVPDMLEVADKSQDVQAPARPGRLRRRADTERPTFLMMDLGTPGADGREALRQSKPTAPEVSS